MFSLIWIQMFLNYKFDGKKNPIILCFLWINIALKESKEVCEITLQYKTILDKQWFCQWYCSKQVLYLTFPEGNVVCCVWIVSDDGNRNKFSVRVEHMARPIDVISEVIRRRGRLMDITKQQVEGLIESYRSTYALKVCGCDEFLLAEKPISQYRVGSRIVSWYINTTSIKNSHQNIFT